MTGDDGIRVLVDGTQVIDGWFYQAPTTYTADVPLSEGQHTVVVEYFEHTGGAVAKFSEAKLADEAPLQALSTEASADLTLSAPFGAGPDPVIQGRSPAVTDGPGYLPAATSSAAETATPTSPTSPASRSPEAGCLWPLHPLTALGVNSATF